MRRLAAGLVGAMLLAGVTPSWAARDELMAGQWGLKIIGAEPAWTVTEGQGVVVAVVDTGVDLKHPDLVGRLLPGKDFVDEDDDPTDEHGHGTLVAGIIAANRGNGIGVAGVAPKASILPVRALNEDGVGSPDLVADAIDWSVSQGADIINLSLSVVPGDSTFDSIFTSGRVERSIEAASNAGALVFIASGNTATGGRSTTAFDASTPGVLVIGASTKGDTRAAYSDYGSGLDLVAPGGGTTRDPSTAGCSQSKAIISTWWTQKGGSVYGATCGTSMATAFASGVGALLVSQGLTNRRAATRMIDTAKDLYVAGPDAQTGSGRVDAAAALGVSRTAKPGKPAPSIVAGGETSEVGTPSKPTKPAKPIVKPSKAAAVSPRPPVVAVAPLVNEPRASASSPPTAVAGGLALLALLALAISLATGRARWAGSR